MQRGFIQVPILIAVLAGMALLAGTSYVSYEVGKKVGSLPEGDVSYTRDVATTTATVEVQAAASSSPSKDQKTTTPAAKTKVDTTPSAPAQTQPSGTGARESTSVASKAPNTMTLPNGAVVEIDASGAIVRYLTLPPGTTAADLTATSSTPSSAIQISAPKVAIGTGAGVLTWTTDTQTQSKIYVTGGGLSSKVFSSTAGTATSHSITIDLASFLLKGDTAYSYEIEATNANGATIKKTGTFKLLSRPYADILVEVKAGVGLNPDLSCAQLFALNFDAFLVCLDYKANP